MIILDGNTQVFQAVLAGAVSTDQPEFQASYGQLNADALVSYLTNEGELNSTTDVALVTGVASRQLGIKSISVFNRDDAQVIITFKKDISATDRFIYRVVLEVNESVHYESARGWFVVDATGVEKSNAGGGAEVNDLSAAVTWANVPEANVPTHTGHVTGGTALTVVVAAITGQTELASGVVDTDELLINDGGVLKRVDASVLATYFGGGGTAWEQVTAADTIATGEGFLVRNTGADFDITIAATIAANEEFIIHNASDSTGQVDIQPNTGHTIKGPFGSAVGGTDTIILAAGETIRMVAISSAVLEII